MTLEELMELKESNQDGAILTKAELRRINWHLRMIKEARERDRVDPLVSNTQTQTERLPFSVNKPSL